jgi:hypothetical protein
VAPAAVGAGRRYRCSGAAGGHGGGDRVQLGRQDKYTPGGCEQHTICHGAGFTGATGQRRKPAVRARESAAGRRSACAAPGRRCAAACQRCAGGASALGARRARASADSGSGNAADPGNSAYPAHPGARPNRSRPLVGFFIRMWSALAPRGGLRAAALHRNAFLSVGRRVADTGEVFGDLPQSPAVGVVAGTRGHVGQLHPTAAHLVKAARPVERAALGVRGCGCI